MVEDIFPRHVGSLALTHNPHHDEELTPEEWVDNHDVPPDWVSELEMNRSTETGELWAMCWSEGPGHEMAVCASNLEVLLAFAKETQKPS